MATFGVTSNPIFAPIVQRLMPISAPAHPITTPPVGMPITSIPAAPVSTAIPVNTGTTLQSAMPSAPAKGTMVSAPASPETSPVATPAPATSAAGTSTPGVSPYGASQAYGAGYTPTSATPSLTGATVPQPAGTSQASGLFGTSGGGGGLPGWWPLALGAILILVILATRK